MPSNTVYWNTLVQCHLFNWKITLFKETFSLQYLKDRKNRKEQMYYLYLWIEKFWKVTSSPPTFKKKKKRKNKFGRENWDFSSICYCLMLFVFTSVLQQCSRKQCLEHELLKRTLSVLWLLSRVLLYLKKS